MIMINSNLTAGIHPTDSLKNVNLDDFNIVKSFNPDNPISPPTSTKELDSIRTFIFEYNDSLYKSTHAYKWNSSGQITDFVFYIVWYSTSRVMFFANRTAYEYDNSERLQKIFLYKDDFSKDGINWILDKKSEYFYNNTNSIDSILQSSFINDTTWQIFYKTLFLYNANNMLIQKRIENKTGVVTEQDDYYYHETNELVDSIILFQNNSPGYTPSTTYMCKLEYDKNGNRIRWDQYIKKDTTEQYEPYLKEELYYNTQGKLSNRMLYLSNDNKNLDTSLIVKNYYDKDNDIILERYYRRNRMSREWEVTKKLFYYYKNSNQKDTLQYNDCFSVFPVPAENFIIITNKKDAFVDAYYRIFDLNGRLLKNGNIENSLWFNIDISSLKKGMYIIEIAGNDLKEVKKFIKN